MNQQNKECIFCQPDKLERVAENKLAFAIKDKYPVNHGHMLIIPKRHVDSYFELAPAEVAAMHELLQRGKDLLEEEYQPDGWNVGVNVGHWGGQTVFHVHMHLIPRFAGDVADPRGGVRNIKEAVVPYPEETGAVVRHDKLVRDGIPEVIAKAGKKAVWHQEKDAKALFHRLQHKLQEEATEYRSNPCMEELADLAEVLDGMAHQQGISMEEVLRVKAQKRQERGGFEQGIVLERVE